MYPKIFFSSSVIRQRSGKCFVIMPFAPNFNEVYETIRDALQTSEPNFVCTRADDLTGGGHIIEDILRGIAEAEFVVADLTGRNPNVFYELGIVHMVKGVEKAILLSQDVESIPFDLRVFRCIRYAQTIQGAKELARSLVAAVQETADKFFRFRLEGERPYTFSNCIIGIDRLAYYFTISDPVYAVDAVKFILKLMARSAGERAVVAYEDSVYLPLSAPLVLPGLDWDLELEQVRGSSASLLLRRHGVA